MLDFGSPIIIQLFDRGGGFHFQKESINYGTPANGTLMAIERRIILTSFRGFSTPMMRMLITVLLIAHHVHEIQYPTVFATYLGPEVII